jgi:DNA-binding response OmpR family regulator
MKGKILIVDDDEEICDELSETLRNEGYQVEAVYDGAEASKMIAKAGYGLVLLDLKLPNLSGFQILERIRSNNIKTKVLILTGRPLVKRKDLVKQLAEQALREENILKLADGIINKPFDVKNLLNKIKELLD